jgi:hypothetical protein
MRAHPSASCETAKVLKNLLKEVTTSVCHTKRWEKMVKTASHFIITIVKNPFFALQNKLRILFLRP